MNWQPIETAPKDKRILLCYPCRVVCGEWNDDRYARKPRPYWGHDLDRVFGLINARTVPPTHWMLIPDFPNAPEQRPEGYAASGCSVSELNGGTQ